MLKFRTRFLVGSVLLFTAVGCEGGKSTVDPSFGSAEVSLTFATQGHGTRDRAPAERMRLVARTEAGDSIGGWQVTLGTGSQWTAQVTVPLRARSSRIILESEAGPQSGTGGAQWAGRSSVLTLESGVTTSATITLRRGGLADLQTSALSIQAGTATLTPGDSVRLRSTTSNGQERVAFWGGGDPAIAVVDATGLVTAVAPGTTRVITALGAATDTMDIVVRPVPVATVTVSPATFEFLALRGTHQFTASAVDANGNPLLGREVTWSSDTPGVASVSATGQVESLSPGTARIRAEIGGVTGEAVTVVKQVPAALVKISGDAQIGPRGQQLAAPLVIEVRDATGHAIAGVTTNWNTGSGPVARVTDAAGRASFNWTLADVTGTQTVTVSAPGAPNVVWTAEAQAQLTLVTNGLLFYDGFNYPNGPLGPPWGVYGPVPTIRDGRWQNDGVMQSGAQTMEFQAPSGTLTLQFRVRSSGEHNQFTAEVREPSTANGFRFNAYPSLYMSLGRTIAGGLTGEEDRFIGVSDFENWSLAKLTFRPGSQQFYKNGTLALGTALTAAESSYLVRLTAFSFEVGHIVEFDDVIVTRSNVVTVTDLPTGYTTRGAGRTAQAVNGTAVLDLGGASSGFTSLEVLNAQGTVVLVHTPGARGNGAQGVFGGDVYRLH